MEISAKRPFESRPVTADLLRHISDICLGLAGAPGPKALLRRFATVLVEHFGVEKFEAIHLNAQSEQRQWKRHQLGGEAAPGLPDQILRDVVDILASTERLGAHGADLRDGCADINISGQRLEVALIEVPRPKAPVKLPSSDDNLGGDDDGATILIWSRAPGTTAFFGSSLDPALQQSALESIVRAMQNEARWLCKLDRTQAMLYRDDLTSLYNCRYLELALEAELRRAERFGEQFSLAFIDLDGFKPINDTYGHLSGSAVLKQVAEVIRDAVREVDIPIRYGGDEFVVLLLGATCAKGVLAAERVRRRIEATEFQLVGVSGTVRTTASIGVATYPEHGRDRETLLRVADETMYQSKRTGKNRVSIVSRDSKEVVLGVDHRPRQR